MKTFFCRRLPPEGEYITPQQCDTHRARPRRDERLTRQDVQRLKEMGLDPDIRQPMACLNCKEWRHLWTTARERETVKKEALSEPRRGLAAEIVQVAIWALGQTLTVKEAAKILGIKDAKLYLWARITPDIRTALQDQQSRRFQKGKAA